MPEEIEARIAVAEATAFGGRVWHGAGCNHCNGTGYYGRIGFFELLLINPAMRRAISDNRPTAELAGLVDPSFKNMRQDGLDQARTGLTTIQEVLRATQDTEEPSV